MCHRAVAPRLTTTPNRHRMVFVTKNQLSRATTLISQYRDGTLPKTVTDKQLWAARKSAWQCVRCSPCHPGDAHAPFGVFGRC